MRYYFWVRIRLRIGFIILLAGVLGGLAWVLLDSSEPEYQGRHLSFWLEQYDLYIYDDEPMTSASSNLTAEQEREHHQFWRKKRDEAKTAIQQIGAAAIPTLLRMASVKRDSELKKNLLKFGRRLFPSLFHSAGSYPAQSPSSEDCHIRAVLGFYALGPLGKDAVPKLIRLLRSSDSDLRARATDCLGAIGPDAEAAVPSILKSLDDTNRMIRWDATANLGRIHSRPKLVVPILLQKLNPSNSVLSTTIGTIGKFGSDAKPAVPALLEYLTNDDEFVRSAATNALKKLTRQRRRRLELNRFHHGPPICEICAICG
jgi:HEAT repeat protein